jgi:glycosyltransferase involved in cell wall biosynthesis/ribosomal protein S18 acetylase RimI-like enzyme
MRIAWLTPLAPTSAIGTFSRRVADRLGRDAEVVLWVEGDGPLQPTSLPVRRYQVDAATIGELQQFDVAIYNFGDYLPFHGPIYEVALAHRGIAILHDRVMHHLFAHYWLTGNRADESTYLKRIAHWYGAEAARRARAGIRGEAPALWEIDEELARMPLYEQAIVNAEAVIVHSADHAADVSSWWTGPVRRLRLPTGDEVLERVDAGRAPAPRPDRRLRALVVGHVNPNRHIDRVLDVLAGDPQLAARLHVDVVGPEEGYAAYADALRRRAADLAPAVSFRVHGRIGDAELERRLAEADLFINLRFPVMEGASASLGEQLAYARPTLVFDAGTFAEVPEDAVARVAPGDFGAVAQQLRALVDDPGRRAEVGRSARAWAEEQTVDAYAQGVLDGIEEAARWRPALRVLDRVGVELGDMGVADELGIVDRIAADFGRVISGPMRTTEQARSAALDEIELRSLTTGDRSELRSFFVRNDVPAVTTTFDPFALDERSADRILDERREDLFFGAFAADGRMLALSMLRGWDEGYETPSFGIAVDHELHGQGLGRRMTAWTIDQARARGCAAVRLTVYDDNPAATTLYGSLGFAEIERRDSGGRGRAVMKLDLHAQFRGRAHDPRAG